MEQEEKKEASWKQQVYNIVRNVASRWHLICLAAAAAAVAGDLMLTLLYVPQYRTEASFAMRMPEYGTEGTEEAEIAEALQYILTSNIFMDKVRAELDVKEINGTYTATEVAGTNIVKIAAEADSPRTSYLMMYAMMNRYREVTDLVIGDMRIDILQKMSVPMQPYNEMKHGRNMALFGLAGGCFVVLVLAAAAFMRDTVKDKNAVKSRLQIRLLGSVPSEPKLVVRRSGLHIKKALLITQITTSTAFVETFRRLRARFEVSAKKHKYKVIAVNSTMENEGKTSVAVNLAIALAQRGKKVLVIDGDLGKPAVGKIMDLEAEKGLEEILKGEAEFTEAISRHERTGVDFLLTRAALDSSSELLEEGGAHKLLRKCREAYDYVFVDTPPAGIMGDALILASYSDAVLLVIRQDYTPLPLLSRTVDRYLAQDTPVMGCVLNRTMPVFRRRSKKIRGGGGKMTENEITIDLYDIFRKLFQIILRTWKIAAAVIIAAAAATVWYVHVSYVPMYETKAAFAVSRELNGEKNYLYNKNAAEELSVSFESILYSDVMQDAMKEQLGTNVLPAQIIFGKIGTTNLFTVSAQSQDPDSAEQVIQAFLDNYARVFRASLMEISLEVIENPEPAVIFNSPQYLRKLTYVCGALVLLYAVLAGVYALLRRTISEEEEVRDYLRTECLGTLPYAKISGKEEKMPLITKDGSRYYEMKEAAGGIRRRMEKQKERDASCAYLIAGASEHEGVSTAAANLALSLAYRGWKTALADLNLRKPSQMERFSGKESGVKKLAMNISGTDIYAEKTELTENLAVYGAVHPVSDTAEILASQKMQHFLDGLKERYDYLIIDSPPLLAFADAQTLAKAADTSLFVIREDRLPASSLMEAMELLNEAAPHVLGCVINGSRIHISKYGYGYGYGYSYGYKYRYGYGYRRRYGYVRAGQDGKRKQPEMKNI